MSRIAQRADTSTTVDAASDGMDDICPVCKSSRYLKPNLKLLVNPECYHKMCESCVDRIFSQGPAQCPVAGCKKTLRKHRFRKQTFGDIQIEREVDIRRRVAEVFNRREDEFDSLLDYNNYLEEVENITFNLVNNIDVAANERKLASYREQNSKVIHRNAALASSETATMQARQAAEKEQARIRRGAARKEEEEERLEREQGKQQIIDQLATGQGNAAEIAKEGEMMLKRTTARRSEAPRPLDGLQDISGTASDFVIRGLKPKLQTQHVFEEPYDPFGGMVSELRYYVPQDHYDWTWLDTARTMEYTAGGYDVREYCHRALCDAFSGLGVLISEEKTATGAAATPSVATDAAVQAVMASTIKEIF